MLPECLLKSSTSLILRAADSSVQTQLRPALHEHRSGSDRAAKQPPSGSEHEHTQPDPTSSASQPTNNLTCARKIAFARRRRCDLSRSPSLIPPPSMSWSLLPYIAGGACASYAAASAYFLRRPMARFVHAPLPMRVRTGAHRGGAAERPENTLAAFAHASSLGIDLLELDVHLTKDGEAVVYHDHSVDRLADHGITGKIAEFTHAELPHVRRNNAPLPPPFHLPGSTLDWTPPESSCPHDLSHSFAPPLLDEVFKRHPHQTVNIDLKHKSPELVEKVAQLIEQHHRQDRTIWGSGQDEMAQQMYKRNPAIPMYTSARSLITIYVKFLVGWLPFSPIKERVIEAPLITAHGRKLLAAHGHSPDTMGFLLRTATRLYSYCSTHPKLLAHLRARNIKVLWWVLNEEDEFAEAFQTHGADGVMTDRPTRLMNWVHKWDAQKEEKQRNGDSASSSSSSSSSSSRSSVSSKDGQQKKRT